MSKRTLRVLIIGMSFFVENGKADIIGPNPCSKNGDCGSGWSCMQVTNQGDPTGSSVCCPNGTEYAEVSESEGVICGPPACNTTSDCGPGYSCQNNTCKTSQTSTQNHISSDHH